MAVFINGLMAIAEDQEKETFKEGPFVVSRMYGKYRVEVYLKPRKHTVLPHSSVCRMLKREKDFILAMMLQADPIVNMVDWLNKQVKNGRIIERHGYWIATQYHQSPQSEYANDKRFCDTPIVVPTRA